MNKTILLKNLKNDTYCRLKHSKVSGVGVVAIKDIPANINPFYLTNKTLKKYKVIKISKKDLQNTNPDVLKMIDDFFYKEDDESYFIPESGLNSLDQTYYLNHSKKPNLNIIESDKSDMLIFKTNKKIKKGEELLINYNVYSDF